MLRRLLPLATCVLLLAGCTSGQADAASKDGPGSPSAGSLKSRERDRIQAQREAESKARIAAVRDAEERGFDFGTGPMKKKGRGADAAAAAATSGPSDRGVRVIWEALAVERDQAENPRFGRKLKGVKPDLKIVLVSDTHPTAQGREKGRASTRDTDGSQIAVLAEKDLRLLVRGLRETGFYTVSRSTGSLQSQFEDESARGRVTIEVDGESQTVLSLRGQGSSPATKDIPRVYSEAKQAVAALRNATPTLNVLTAGGNKLPQVVPKKRGERRVLTEKEAAEILGQPAPSEPVPPPSEEDWLGRPR
jgi:hypothetical protein